MELGSRYVRVASLGRIDRAASEGDAYVLQLVSTVLERCSNPSYMAGRRAGQTDRRARERQLGRRTLTQLLTT